MTELQQWSPTEFRELNALLRELTHRASLILGTNFVGGGALWAVNEGRLIQLEPKTGRVVTSIKIGDCPHFATPTLHRSLVLVGTLTGVTAVRTS